MNNRYLLIEFTGDDAPFIPYLEGYFRARNVEYEDNVFLDDSYGLEHDSMFTRLSEWMKLREEHHLLVIDGRIIPYFDEALRKLPADTSLTITSRKWITSLRYPFSAKIFSHELGERLCQLIEETPTGLTIENKKMKQRCREDLQGHGFYSGEHAYELTVSGVLSGDVRYILDHYNKLSDFDQVIFESPIFKLVS